MSNPSGGSKINAAEVEQRFVGAVRRSQLYRTLGVFGAGRQCLDQWLINLDAGAGSDAVGRWELVTFGSVKCGGVGGQRCFGDRPVDVSSALLDLVEPGHCHRSNTVVWHPATDKTIDDRDSDTACRG